MLLPIATPWTHRQSKSKVSGRVLHSGNGERHQNRSNARRNAPPSCKAARANLIPTSHYSPNNGAFLSCEKHPGRKGRTPKGCSAALIFEVRERTRNACISSPLCEQAQHIQGTSHGFAGLAYRDRSQPFFQKRRR